MQFSAKRSSKGFALLITITLLAFLVLLLVSLASLTRVETQVASNNQQLAQARQNALMALNIALGELQKYTGPDQRTTARSDMDSTLATTSTQSGRWTGAYGNGVPVGGFGNPNKYDESPVTIQTNLSTYYTDPTNATDPYVLKGSQARLLNWLVSGNESTTFVAANSGQITTKGTGITFSPTDPVVLGGGTALSTDIKVKNLPARLLVGPNSATDTSDYVAAPLVPISAVSPGLGAAPVAIGNYAWWVGDEGAKARLNLPLSTDARNKPLAFASSQRAAIELVDGIHPVGSTAVFAPTDLIGSAYSPSQANLTSLMNTAQLPMLTPASATALATAVKYRYHDLTGYATSVLSDTYAGGLKKDLSKVLADTSPVAHPSPEGDTDFIFTPKPNSLPGDTNLEMGIPTWGQLRSFAKTTDTSTNPGGTPGLTPIPPEMLKVASSALPVATTVGIAPIMTYCVMGFKYIAPGGSDSNGYPVAGNAIRLAGYPIVVLWNPYTTDILPKKYEIGIQRPTYYGRIELQGRSGPLNTAYVWSATNRIENQNLIYANSSDTTDPYFRFIVDNTKGIKAGQSLVFTLQTSDHGQNYTSAGRTLTDADYNSYNYVLLLPNRGNVIGTAPAPPAGAPYTIAGVTYTPTIGENTYRVGVNKNATKTHYNSAMAAVTYFDTAAWTNDYETFSWSGLGTHQAYLSDIVPVSNKPSGSTPYTVSGSTFTSRKWYQSMTWQWVGNMGEAPFGWNVSYPTDPTTSAVLPSGPDAGKWSALVQSEGRLEVVGTKPAWRIQVKAHFQELSAAWLSQGNPRGFQSTNNKLAGGYQINFTGGGPGNNVGSSWKIPASQWPPFSVTIDPADGLAKSRSGADWWQPGVVDSTLFEFRAGTMPLLSIGQLQHANLGWNASSPAYAIGNSMAPSFLNAQSFNSGAYTLPAAFDKLVRSPSDYADPAGALANIYANGFFNALYDQSWLLNRALWDKYFVSTVANKGTATDSESASVTPNTTVPLTLPNPRHIRYNDDPSNPATTLRDENKVAAHLLLAGGFNINSTSEQAWRAVLGGTNQVSYDPTGTATGGSAYTGPVYSRFSKPTTNSTANIWQGYRQLTQAQIVQFAKNIVAEIRNRGPFISLADFINRRTADSTVASSTIDERSKGTIQAALDNTTTPAGINPAAPVTFAPQYLTQADVLSTLGSGLSARSDTFVIRTYGEVLDAVNSTASDPVIGARAWCEAVVQRLPDYVDPLIAADAQLHTFNPGGNAALTLARKTNLAFGRKYKIISFRWLTQNDI
jgi:type II secretory pathway pseudopilin PulG